MGSVRIGQVEFDFFTVAIFGVTLMMGLAASGLFAAGTNTIAVMSQGVTAVGDTLQSTEIVGKIGFWLMAISAVGLARGNMDSGWMGFFVCVFMIGVLMNGQNIVEAIGWTAAVV